MSLRDILLARIAQTGPISIAEYMAECLLHPEHGYYTTARPFGTQGDFTTAPEISQMFGELIGLSLAQSWLDQGAPAPFTLAELGPGRGTLMADMLRATAAVPGFHAAMDLCLIEAAPQLQATQEQSLAAICARAGITPRWITDPRDLPGQPLWAVANEFFDALPIRQFIRDGQGWRERLVGAGQTAAPDPGRDAPTGGTALPDGAALPDGTAQPIGTALHFGLGAAAPQPALSHRLEDTEDGDLVELCPAAVPISHHLGQLIARHGGAALLIDYGDWRSLGDTFQAVQGHDKADPLADPGRADLTAHVDFEPLASAAAPAAHSLLCPQGVFLERLGITARATALASAMQGDILAAHIAAHRRLTHPDEMGSLFKVLGLYPQGAQPPAGLEPAPQDPDNPAARPPAA